MTPANSFPKSARSWPALATRASRGVWLTALPALLAVVALRYLVPAPSPELPAALRALVRPARAFPLVAGALLFVLFALVGRYWAPRLGLPARGPTEPVRSARATPWREAAVISLMVATVVAITLLARWRFGEPLRVLTASMLPNLEPGAQVLGNKLAYKGGQLPKRGDIVVLQTSLVPLNEPSAPPVLLKRVIGLPGDKVQMQAGLPIINGWPVPTCDAGEYVYLVPNGEGGAVLGRLLVEFLDDKAYLTVHMATKPFTDTYEVKPGEVFVLGDNRSNSLDSRTWNGGHGAGAPLSAVRARVDRFLVGTHLDGRTDWRRALRPVDASIPRVWADGYDPAPIEAGIAKCFRDRPSVTHPPAPGGPVPPPPRPVQGSF